MRALFAHIQTYNALSSISKFYDKAYCYLALDFLTYCYNVWRIFPLIIGKDLTNLMSNILLLYDYYNFFSLNLFEMNWIGSLLCQVSNFKLLRDWSNSQNFQFWYSKTIASISLPIGCLRSTWQFKVFRILTKPAKMIKSTFST